VTESYLYVVALRVPREDVVSFWHTLVSASDEHEAYSNGYKAFSKCTNTELGLTKSTVSELLNDYVIKITELVLPAGLTKGDR